MSFKPYDSAESISEDVQNGSLASAVVNEREAFMLMKEDGLQIIPLLASPKESYVFLMRNTDNDLRQSLEQFRPQRMWATATGLKFPE